MNSNLESRIAFHSGACLGDTLIPATDQQPVEELGSKGRVVLNLQHFRDENRCNAAEAFELGDDGRVPFPPEGIESEAGGVDPIYGVEGLRVRWTSLGVIESLAVGEEAKVHYRAVLRRLPVAVEEVGLCACGSRLPVPAL
ncbi:hypothetical protein SLEP1_g18164 [Rubroshorea leprosula]|uniref:Uncharacterized protein n=1 Tax=Rubroshorea leprosula TaxID=152421 RepID=A0AAV5J081_9ROSI|nr:hypothetical protein SLEP1_g18164 [Rubroshorea leprosula]